MRNEELFNNGWEFVKMPFGTGIEEVSNTCKWKEVILPHDWLIYDTNDLYGDATGWYRKTFVIDKEQQKRYLLNFDGVYMDSRIYINGIHISLNHY